MKYNDLNPIGSSNLKLGIILIALGLLFGIDQVLNINFLAKLWPILTLVLGIGCIGIYRTIPRRGILYLAAGEYIVLFSFLATYCNFTSWETILLLWPIFIAYLGVVLFSLYLINKDNRKLYLAGIGFFLLSIFLYLVFSINENYWWTIFIFSGLFMILLRKKQ